MHVFSAALALSLLSGTAANAQYDPEDNQRPTNITDLDYRIYRRTGSYYNGSITFQLDLRDRNVDDDDPDEYPGTVCHSFIDHSISLTYSAVAAIAKNGRDFKETNPVMIDLYGVDKPFELTPGPEKGYSEYQEFELRSASVFDGAKIWDFSLSDSPSAGFNVSGQLSDKDFQRQDLKFNLSSACGDESGAPSRDEDEYLFEGSLVTPDWYEWLWEDWADSVPWPTFKAEFDNTTASVDVESLFSLHTVKTAIVGRLRISFKGDVDEQRSDELLTGGGERPEWKPTLGFSEESESGTDSGLRSSVVPVWMTLGSVVLTLCVLRYQL